MNHLLWMLTYAALCMVVAPSPYNNHHDHDHAIFPSSPFHEILSCHDHDDDGYCMPNEAKVESESESEPNRRILHVTGYISYAALAKDRVPCDMKGHSYYNCHGHQRANPYNRGCTRVTACARSTR